MRSVVVKKVQACGPSGRVRSALCVCVCVITVPDVLLHAKTPGSLGPDAVDARRSNSTTLDDVYACGVTCMCGGELCAHGEAGCTCG